MDRVLYYRSLSRSADIWRKGKEVQSFPSDVGKQDYIRHMKEGKGFPSIWCCNNSNDLERIALGIILCRGHFDKVEFIGFDKYCFDKTNINIVQATDSNFPIPSVGILHHELIIDRDTGLDSNLTDSISVFLECNGALKRFPKKSEKEMSMLRIIKKYAGEIIDDRYIEKANEWIAKFNN